MMMAEPYKFVNLNLTDAIVSGNTHPNHNVTPNYAITFNILLNVVGWRFAIYIIRRRDLFFNWFDRFFVATIGITLLGLGTTALVAAYFHTNFAILWLFFSSLLVGKAVQFLMKCKIRCAANNEALESGMESLNQLQEHQEQEQLRERQEHLRERQDQLRERLREREELLWERQKQLLEYEKQLEHKKQLLGERKQLLGERKKQVLEREKRLRGER